jgi:hypothetical protein
VTTRPTAAAPALSIDSSDSKCAVSKVDLPSGSNKFKITNSGSKVTEVYFYGPDGKIVSEKENIGPGTFYEITVTLGAGKQQIVLQAGHGRRRDQAGHHRDRHRHRHGDPAPDQGRGRLPGLHRPAGRRHDRDHREVRRLRQGR